MIGWENNQGAYFVQKLQAQVDGLDTDIDTVEASVSTNAGNIGKMSDLATTAKDTLVKAVNEVKTTADNASSSASTANTNIGTLANLTTTAKTDIVSAINELVSRVQALENPAPEVPDNTTEGGES